nr:hypothetical protein [Tanacetum cinerariifolium]
MSEVGKVLCTAEVQGHRLRRIYSKRSEFGRTVGNKMHKAFPLPGESSHWQYKFPLPVKIVPTTRRLEMSLPEVCTDIEEMMKKLPAIPLSKQSNIVNQSETEITSDSNIIPYSHYLSESQHAAVQNLNFPAQQDELILSLIAQLKTKVFNCTKINLDNKNVNETLTAELERYKDQVRILKEGNNVDKFSDLCGQSVEIDNLKQTLSKHLKEKESLKQTVTLLKNDFLKEESRNIDRELALEKQIKDLNNIKTNAIVIRDSEETLRLAEESRSKMLLKQKDPMMSKKKVNTKPVDYAALNQLSQDFEKRFVPQTGLSAEQVFWSQNFMNSNETNLSTRPTQVEVPKELPKVSMVNTSLKKLKHHLASFDVVVKERTTTIAITEDTEQRSFSSEKEAIHMILTRIRDEIYSTIDACQTAQEMWEAIERFYKLMNEMIRNNLTVTTIQVNFQFLQQLQPEWSRFVTIVKKQHKLDEVSYYKLFDVLKQYQNQVNELRAERLARNANPLALVTTAQADQDQYYQTSRTSSNSKNKNVDTTLRYKNDDHSGKFGNQMMVNVVAAREKVGKQYDWLPDTDKEVDEQELEAHYSYMAKIQEVPTVDSCTDSEPVEQVRNDAGYNVFANGLKHSEQSESVSNTCLVEMDDSNVIPDSPDMCEDDIQNDQNDVESDDECGD